MKRFTVLPLLLICAVAFCSGCFGRAVSEVSGTVMGAKGVAIPVQNPAAYTGERPLGVYTSFRIQPFNDDRGARVPELVKQRLPGYFYKELADKKIFNGNDGKALIIRGQYVYYESSDKAVSQVFGPFEEVIARVELVDAASGKVIGVADCVGRSTQSVNKGPDAKAEGLAKAIVSWIDRNYPVRPD